MSTKIRNSAKRYGKKKKKTEAARHIAAGVPERLGNVRQQVLHQKVEDHRDIFRERNVFENSIIHCKGIEASTVPFSRRHNKACHAVVCRMQINNCPDPALCGFDSVVPERERRLPAIDASMVNQCGFNAPSKRLDVCLETGEELFCCELQRVEGRGSEFPRKIAGGRIELGHVDVCLVGPSP